MFRAKIFLVSILLFQVSCSVADQGLRASRPDALSYPGSTPEIVSSFESVAALLAQIKQCVCRLQLASATCCELINSRLDIIQDFALVCCEQTQSRLQLIESTIDTVSGCATIPITAPATITLPGSYCLQNNSTSAITIAANNVALNLSNHSLGSVVIGAVTDVSVVNGFIEGGPGVTVSGATNVELGYLQINNATVNAISLDTATSTVAIHDVIIVNPVVNGINLNNVSRVTIKNAFVTFAQARGISVGASGASEIVIEDSSVYRCATIGFNLSDSCKIVNSVAAYNGSYGIRLISPLATSSMYAQDCVVMNNVDTGFRIEGGKSVLLNVTSINNGNVGFFATQGALIMCDGCIAESNTSDGFDLDNIPVTTGTIRGCSAINNGGYGFNDESLALSPIIYINNIASNNNGAGTGQNYNVAAGTAPFYSQDYTAVQTGTASNYWRNIAAPTVP